MSRIASTTPSASNEWTRTAATSISVIGSTVLVHSLLAEGVVDDLRLMIDPVLVGGGKRIFPEDGALRLRLVC